jgi:hypothetical protein
MVEIDALVAIALGVTADELATIYRTQFPVLSGYDRDAYFYDANGRLVPNSVLTVWRQRGPCVDPGELASTHPGSGIEYRYVPPIASRDRESELKRAHTEFVARLASRTSNSA